MKIKNYASVRQNFDEFRLNVRNFKLGMLKIGADRVFIGALDARLSLKHQSTYSKQENCSESDHTTISISF